MHKFFYSLVAFLGVSLLILALIILRTDTSYYNLMTLVFTMYQVGWFVLISQWYLTVYVRKIWLMARRHFYEFKVHAFRDITQLIVTYLAIWIINIGTTQWVFIDLCSLEEGSDVEAAS